MIIVIIEGFVVVSIAMIIVIIEGFVVVFKVPGLDSSKNRN